MTDASSTADLPPTGPSAGSQPDQAAADLPPAELPAGAPDQSAGRPPRPISRRTALIALAAGGAALVTTNGGTALVAERISTTMANRRAQVKIDELQGEVSRLERQLALYEDMERIGLDKLIRAVLETYDRFWPPVRSTVRLLLSAVGTAEEALAHFELKLPSMRSATQIMAGLLTGLEAQIQSAQEALNDMLKRSGPIGEAVSGFLSWLLNRNPFGITTTVREASDRLSALVAGIPPLIADVRRRLLGPLDEEWLATAAGEGLQGILFDPLRTNLLTPLRTHLEEIEQAANDWEEEARPVRTALDERDKIRAEIARLDGGPEHAAAEVVSPL